MKSKVVYGYVCLFLTQILFCHWLEYVRWLTSELELLPSWQLSLVETSSHDKVLSRNFFWDKETTLFPTKDRSSFQWDFSWSCMLYDCSTHTQASAECEKQCIYQFSSYFHNFLTLIKKQVHSMYRFPSNTIMSENKYTMWPNT